MVVYMLYSFRNIDTLQTIMYAQIAFDIMVNLSQMENGRIPQYDCFILKVYSFSTIHQANQPIQHYSNPASKNVYFRICQF